MSRQGRAIATAQGSSYLELHADPVDPMDPAEPTFHILGVGYYHEL